MTARFPSVNNALSERHRFFLINASKHLRASIMRFHVTLAISFSSVAAILLVGCGGFASSNAAAGTAPVQVTGSLKGAAYGGRTPISSATVTGLKVPSAS